ncbi:uncharacterized protein isoform X2 [Leptinotarsa decemlineata]|uniref:uncharacterized protein isoform X2 n=1 Tax=Leptinotarsa decemlineata TaxID=7539 RepID=UPI003D30CAA4
MDVGNEIIHNFPYLRDKKSSTQSEKKKESLQGGKSKKKSADNRWVGKSEKQVYTNSWFLSSLKGHTGAILDMDFSSNGKYLTSCGDEDPDPGGLTTESSSSSDCIKESSRVSSKLSVVPSSCTKGLSRRQRKNRRRDDASPSENQKLKKQKAKKTLEPAQLLTKKQVMAVVPLRQFVKFNAPERTFAGLLHNYLITFDEMSSLGYPIKPNIDQNSVIIYKNARSINFPVHSLGFDVNAREFVPKNDCNSNDSGQGSGSSSDSGENFDGEDLSSGSSSDQDSATYFKQNQVTEPPPGENYTMRTCCRCSRIFYTKEDEYITKEKCYHHWGKLHKLNNPGDKRHGQFVYECCERKVGSMGCTEGRLHVWNGLVNGINGFFYDYVFTKPRRNPPADGNYGVYALDCEMCYTVRGLEVTKVTVVGVDGRLVYDSYVKPEREIVDYNTRFSGITAKEMKQGAPKNIREVQNDLMGFINADTILIGHGLENDLRALKIVHYIIVDTAHAFPHFKGPPYRRSLKNLTSTILKREIQCSANGHNSYEDASACMELMLWRVRRDFRSYLSHH